MRHQQRLKEIAEGKRDRPKGRQLYNGMNTTQTIDNSTPRTYILAKQLESKGDKRRSQWQQQLQDHRSNLTKSQERMATYPTPTERRANRFDPVAHPVQFKRSHAAAAGGGASVAAVVGAGGGGGVKGRVERDIMYSTGATRSQRYYYAHPLSGALLPRQEYDSAMLITQQMDGQGRRRRSRQEAEVTSVKQQPKQQQRPRTAGQVGRGGEKVTPREWEEKQAVDFSRSRGNSSVTSRLSRPHTAQPRSSSNIVLASPASRTASPATSPSHGYVIPTSPSPPPPSYDALDTADYDSDDSTPSLNNPPNPYDQLYSNLVSLLLAHRIVSADGIEQLLQRAAQVNGHLDRKKVEWVCEAVRQEMRLRGESEEREKRVEQRMQAWQNGEEEIEDDESRAESEGENEEEEKVQEAEADEEAYEEEPPVTESEWQALAAQPFYQRPPPFDDEADRQRLQQQQSQQQADEKQQLKKEHTPPAKQRQFDEDDRPQQQLDSEGEFAQSKQKERANKTEAAENASKQAVASPADDEWYEDDIEPTDAEEAEEQLPQPPQKPENNSAQYEKELLRTESGTHTIEEGDEEDEEADAEYEQTYEVEAYQADTQEAEAEQTEAKQVEAAEEDEYGDEKYEDDENFEEEEEF